MSESPATSIKHFMDNFTKGFAFSNRYTVEIYGINGIDLVKTAEFHDMGDWYDSSIVQNNIVGFNNSLKGDKLKISCSSMMMPGKSINNNYHYQTNTKWVSGYSTDPVTFSFYADENLSARKYLESWQNAVVNHNNTLNFYSEYTSNVKLIQNSRIDNTETYSVILYDAFPISISPIEYSMSSDNQIVQIMVSLMYKNWTQSF